VAVFISTTADWTIDQASKTPVHSGPRSPAASTYAPATAARRPIRPGQDPASFAKTAVLLPYLLHILLAAAGTYVFLRHTLATSRLGALAGSVLYAFSPAFSTGIETISEIVLTPWLPWLAVAGTAFLRRGGAIRWAMLLLVLVIINSTGVMTLLVRLYAFTALLFQ
jgi:hypothetical protein